MKLKGNYNWNLKFERVLMLEKPDPLVIKILIII